jgi:hypothetical protein
MLIYMQIFKLEPLDTEAEISMINKHQSGLEFIISSVQYYRGAQ